MKRWFRDRLFLRSVLLAAAVGAGTWADASWHGWPVPVARGVEAACAVMIGASAMRLWTWKEKS